MWKAVHSRDVLLLSALMFGILAPQAARAQFVPATVPAAPADLEAKGTNTTEIALAWDAVTGAAGYYIYRSTTSGAETAYATSKVPSFLDRNVVTGPPTVYYYRVAAVNAAGVSALSNESGTPTPLPASKGTGQVAGVPITGGSVFYCKDAFVTGFEWFEQLHGWFPSVLHTSYANTPTHQVVDMAYAGEGAITFNNVVVPKAGHYLLNFRYAFASGLFPGVTDRQEGIAVNGAMITNHMDFLITHSFSVYASSSITVPLKAGKNSVTMFNVSDHGISRVDTMTVTYVGP